MTELGIRQNFRSLQTGFILASVAALSLIVGCQGVGKSNFVSPPPGPTGDFSVSVSPSTTTVNAGTPATYTVTVSPSGGFTGTVNLSVTGLPSAGPSASFNPASVITSGTSTLTISSSSSVAAGNYPFTVTATSGTLNHTATAKL